MKHGSIITLQSQIGSQLRAQQKVKTVQSDQNRKCQLVRFWPPYFEMRTVFYSSITLRKKEPSIANIIWRYWCAEGKNCKKITPNTNKVVCHQDNALCHKSIATIAKSQNFLFEFLPHPCILQIWLLATTTSFQA